LYTRIRPIYQAQPGREYQPRETQISSSCLIEGQSCQGDVEVYCISSEAEVNEYICEWIVKVDTKRATNKRPQGAVISRVRLINTGTYAIYYSVLYRLKKRNPRNLTWIYILGSRSKEGISTPVRVVNLEIGRYDLQQYGSK
jgi:hypothetical protein